MTRREDEVIDAERARALSLLDDAERLISRLSGYLEHPDQRLLRSMRAFLEETGQRQSVAPKIWKDRECKCVVHAGKRIASVDCEMPGHKPGRHIPGRNPDDSR